MTTPSDQPADRRPVEHGAERGYRPELQGLRAVAVALVVVYHVWFGRVSGGVDVFFVVSGFLLTGQLARAAERGPLALRQAVEPHARAAAAVRRRRRW